MLTVPVSVVTLFYISIVGTAGKLVIVYILAGLVMCTSL